MRTMRTVVLVVILVAIVSPVWADQAQDIVRDANEATGHQLTAQEIAWLTAKHGHDPATFRMACELCELGIIHTEQAVAWDGRHIALAYQIFTVQGRRDVELTRRILAAMPRFAPCTHICSQPYYAPPSQAPAQVCTKKVRHRNVVAAAVQPVSGTIIEKVPTVLDSVIGAAGNIVAARFLRPARIKVSQVGGGASIGDVKAVADAEAAASATGVANATATANP